MNTRWGAGALVLALVSAMMGTGLMPAQGQVGDLSPASGSWLGWYQSGNADPRLMEPAYGRKADAFRRYYSLSDKGSWPTARDVEVAQADGGRRILFASVNNKCHGKPSKCPAEINGRPLPAPLVISEGNPDFDGEYFTPAQISSGALDPIIDAQAAQIKASGLRFVLDLMHEVDTLTEKMDDVTVKPEYGGMTLRDWWETTYPAAYRHWRDRLKAQGATNVVFAVNYAGFRSDTTVYTRTYPGDAYVDWISWDPYDFYCMKGGTQPTWSHFYNRLEAGLLGQGARSKSYALFETAVGGDSTKSSCRVAWINGMAEAAAALPKIKAVLYFDRASADYNLESDPAVQAAWVTEIKSPYFNQHEDQTAPTVTTRTPASGGTGVSVAGNVTATFSESVQGVSGATFRLTNAGTGAAVSAVVSRNGTTNQWILNPSANLSADTRYTASLSGGPTAIRDAAGNPLTTTSWSFTTGPRPTVTTRTPASGATAVSRTANITATFSENVQGVGGATFKLTSATGAAVAATVTRNGATNQWILNPGTTLAPGTRYTATLTGGPTAIRDVAGNPLTTTSWSFTTGT